MRLLKQHFVQLATIAGLAAAAALVAQSFSSSTKASVVARRQPAAAADEIKPYTETIPGTDVKFDMLPIPGGTFTMGSPAEESGRHDDEGPQHDVQVSPFWMGKCEVTWDEYDLFAFSMDIKKKKAAGINLDQQPESEKLADALTRPTPPYADETFGLGRRGQPVICITWHAAMEYCRWLSTKTGKSYRLPTEAEWEYACRAGSKSAYCFGDDPASLGDYAWYIETSLDKPQPVGKKKPNAWGLHDMHGNVAEWCLDIYDAKFYGTFSPGKEAINPFQLPDARKYPHVARGGAWDGDVADLRSGVRLASDREGSVQDPQRPQSIWWHTDATFVGFRIVRAVEETEQLRGLRSQVIED